MISLFPTIFQKLRVPYLTKPGATGANSSQDVVNGFNAVFLHFLEKLASDKQSEHIPAHTARMFCYFGLCDIPVANATIFGSLVLSDISDWLVRTYDIILTVAHPVLVTLLVCDVPVPSTHVSTGLP